MGKYPVSDLVPYKEPEGGDHIPDHCVPEGDPVDCHHRRRLTHEKTKKTLMPLKTLMTQMDLPMMIYQLPVIAQWQRVPKISISGRTDDHGDDSLQGHAPVVHGTPSAVAPHPRTVL